MVGLLATLANPPYTKSPNKEEKRSFEKPQKNPRQEAPGAIFFRKPRRQASEQRSAHLCMSSTASAGNEELRKKMVPGARIELARPEERGILSPLRLPIPPPGQFGCI